MENEFYKEQLTKCGVMAGKNIPPTPKNEDCSAVHEVFNLRMEYEKLRGVAHNEDSAEAPPVSLSALLARTQKEIKRVDEVLSVELGTYVRNELTRTANALDHIASGINRIIGSVSG
jgi:hypothetical protein